MSLNPTPEKYDKVYRIYEIGNGYKFAERPPKWELGVHRSIEEFTEVREVEAVQAAAREIAELRNQAQADLIQCQHALEDAQLEIDKLQAMLGQLQPFVDKVHKIEGTPLDLDPEIQAMLNYQAATWYSDFVGEARVVDPYDAYAAGLRAGAAMVLKLAEIEDPATVADDWATTKVNEIGSESLS